MLICSVDNYLLSPDDVSGYGKAWERDDSEQDKICSCSQKAYSLEGECIVSDHEMYKCNSFLFSFIIIMPFPLIADTCWWNKFNKAYLN